ncbi:centrosomal protein of 112 kDa-like [Eptesicus fuscus]|uniref:centrosomal protein of 112 kDa-like n=1 Tax=Eptesicus fuscus TaxID=29078 RepID=UPI00240486A9|nr:centrosomal protein of 112 kDa-like [Eptesicus fuscus]
MATARRRPPLKGWARGRGMRARKSPPPACRAAEAEAARKDLKPFGGGGGASESLHEVHLKKSAVSLDDSDIEARLNSWNLGIENPRYLRQKPIPVSLMTPKFSLRKSSSFHEDHLLSRMHEKELDMKTKMIEAKCHEEKLKLQQKHDADVQKILERKNSEIEELKTLYKTKQNETEETVRKLEKKDPYT